MRLTSNDAADASKNSYATIRSGALWALVWNCGDSGGQPARISYDDNLAAASGDKYAQLAAARNLPDADPAEAQCFCARAGPGPIAVARGSGADRSDTCDDGLRSPEL